ncbi:MAG: hypothetical protein JWM11_2329 [Planctomycetaceae bacterium]|nr:hypothetical protein [Planctomycetaceae bacterium]
MPVSTVQFISQVKLEELRRQRSLLVEAYDRLWAECEAQAPAEALRGLYRGLAAIKIGRNSLHSDLGDIGLLIHSVGASSEIVSFWRKKLETEWRMGRLRSEIVYLFGALLGEWGGESKSRREFLQERRQVHDSLLEIATTPSPPNEHRRTVIGGLERVA